MVIKDGQYWNQMMIFFAVNDREAIYSQQKKDQELTVAQIMNFLLQNSDLNWNSRETTYLGQSDMI